MRVSCLFLNHSELEFCDVIRQTFMCCKIIILLLQVKRFLAVLLTLVRSIAFLNIRTEFVLSKLVSNWKLLYWRNFHNSALSTTKLRRL